MLPLLFRHAAAIITPPPPFRCAMPRHDDADAAIFADAAYFTPCRHAADFMLYAILLSIFRLFHYLPFHYFH